LGYHGAILFKALEFYADEENYCVRFEDDYEPILQDNGKTARQALGWFDAWKVVEKLKITVIPQDDSVPKWMRYLAEIDNRPFGKYYSAFAETAQLAICLAALKAVGVKVEVTK